MLRKKLKGLIERFDISVRQLYVMYVCIFFLPLLLAGLHLVFAFPFVHKLLLLFNLWNTRLLVGTTAASFLAFAVLYTLVYRATSTAYYHIVSDGGDR